MDLAPRHLLMSLIVGDRVRSGGEGLLYVAPERHGVVVHIQLDNTILVKWDNSPTNDISGPYQWYDLVKEN